MRVHVAIVRAGPIGTVAAFRLQFDPPLAGGTVAVRYEVRAEDGHVLAGNFVFDVDAAPPTAPTITAPPPAPSTSSSAPATSSPAPAATPPGGTEAAPPTSVPGATPGGSVVDSLGDPDDEDGGSGNGIVLALAAVVALAAGFVIVRSRTST